MTERPAESRPRRTSPSLSLLAILIIFVLSVIGYAAIIWSGELHGYEPSKIVAARDLAFFIPLTAIFFWLTRVQRFRGEMLIFAAGVFLFSIGALMQYRLFSDPEYGARGGKRMHAREAKAQAVRLRDIQTGYDDEKKKFMFGGSGAVPAEPPGQNLPVYEKGFGDILSSVNTYIPLAAFLALVTAFLVFKNERALLWLQRRAMILGIATMAPFAAMVLLFSEEGKFLGQTTPWEPVKIVFLVSFAGVLAGSYRNLRRTRWGLPHAQYLLPFAVIAAMPVVPFFALSDFGQMLVFFGVYVMLYIVAVRKKAQMAYAVLLFAAVFGIFFTASSAKTGFGLPARVYFRFYMWRHTWEPPPPDTWWWHRDYERYLRLKNLTVDPSDPGEVKQRNNEAWADKVLQQSQGLFGIHEGGVRGAGLGLGYPETVPISDSDFIYAAIAEETGLLGSLVLMLMMAVLVVAGIGVCLATADMFSKLLSAGFAAFVGFQAIVNMGGVLRLLPMTGITLPLVSHGGWSLITSFAMLGILLALSHKNAITRAAELSSAAVPRPDFTAVK
jgi:cell division protein FtsW (lipid II flippase)